MKIQILSAAVGLFAISTTAALAMPVAKFGSASAHLSQVADKKGDGKKMKSADNDAKKSSSKITSGDSAKLYGKWHKMDKRPADWNKKACVTAGDVWYCP